MQLRVMQPSCRNLNLTVAFPAHSFFIIPFLYVLAAFPINTNTSVIFCKGITNMIPHLILHTFDLRDNMDLVSFCSTVMENSMLLR